MNETVPFGSDEFYDNSILLGTKIHRQRKEVTPWFYDNSILLGTKIHAHIGTQKGQFYDNSILLGTKISDFFMK